MRRVRFLWSGFVLLILHASAAAEPRLDDAAHFKGLVDKLATPDRVGADFALRAAPETADDVIAQALTAPGLQLPDRIRFNRSIRTEAVDALFDLVQRTRPAPGIIRLRP